MLASIGIEHGKPFEPDERMWAILSEAATVGSAMALAISYRTRLPLRRYEDREWIEIGNTGYPRYEQDGHTILDGLALMGWFATGSSIAMVKPPYGKGSAYMWTYTDAEGEWLDGAKRYTLTLPSPIPAADFWSAAAFISVQPAQQMDVAQAVQIPDYPLTRPLRRHRAGISPQFVYPPAQPGRAEVRSAAREFAGQWVG